MTDTITLPRSVIERTLKCLNTPENQDLRLVSSALYAALAQQAEQVQCEWTQDPDDELGDTYHSSCGELWSFVDGGPKENRVSYCHHCGKPVKMAAAPKGLV